jgi:hypothetical protein
VTVSGTPKGNWRIYYDGKDTGLTVAGDLLDPDTIDEYGLARMEESYKVKTLNNRPKKMLFFLQVTYTAMSLPGKLNCI